MHVRKNRSGAIIYGSTKSKYSAQAEAKCYVTHHVNLISDSHTDGQPCSLWIQDECMHMQCFTISFQCDNVIVLQSGWTFLVWEAVQVFGLVAPDWFFLRIYIYNGLGTRLMQLMQVHHAHQKLVGLRMHHECRRFMSIVSELWTKW